MIKKIVFLLLLIIPLFAQEIEITTAAGSQFSPDVATDGTDFLVVWEDARAGTGNPNIYGRVVLADGSIPGVEEPICSFMGLQRIPAVDFGDTYYLTAWSDQRSGYKVYGELVSTSGMPWSGNFEIATAAGSIQRVEVSGATAGFLVVWEERISGISHLKACVTYESITSTAAIDLSDTDCNQKSPSAAFGDAGWIVVFEDSASTGKGIYAVKVDTLGARVGSPYMIVEGVHGESSPAIAASGSGFIVAYERDGGSTGRDIFGILLSSSGAPSGVPFPISTADNNQVKPDVSFDSLGYLVIWQDNRSTMPDIYGQRVTTGATLSGSEFAICDSSGTQQKAKATSNNVHHLVTWEDNRNPTPDIFAARIERMTPSEAPEVVILQPDPLSITSCNRYPIKLLITDTDGIDPYTALFTVMEDTFTAYSIEMIFVGDTMRFVPSSDWPDGDSINLCLLDIADSLDNHIESPICWVFFADLTEPVFSNERPRDGQVVDSFPDYISANIADSVSGVDPATIIFVFDGDSFAYDGVSVTWDGFTARLFPPPPVDTLGTHTVSIIVGDNPDACEPNVAVFSWDFFINPGGGPSASQISPRDGDVVSEALPDVDIMITDEDGINTSTIELYYAGTLYTWPTGMVFTDSILTFSPTTASSHGDVVSVSLTHVEDIWGNDLGAPLSFSFSVDLLGPDIIGFYPALSETLHIGVDDIRVLAEDFPAGFTVDDEHVVFGFYDLSMDLLEEPVGGLISAGDTIVLQSGAFGSHLGDDVAINICVELMDDIDVGLPNSSDTCWQVWVEQMTIGEILFPENIGIKIKPNPFNAACVIEAPGNIEIYDITGKLVERFPANGKSDGYHRFIWMPKKSVSSGVYLVRLTGGREATIARILLIR